MLKKTALFLRDGFPINHKCKKDPFPLAGHDIHPAGEFAKQEAGVGRGGHRSSSQPLLRGRDLLAVHPQASSSNSTCTTLLPLLQQHLLVLVVEKSTCPLLPAGCSARRDQRTCSSGCATGWRPLRRRWWRGTRTSGFLTQSCFLRKFLLGSQFEVLERMIMLIRSEEP